MRPRAARDLDELRILRRAGGALRAQAHSRWRRLRDHAWQIGQCAIAAGIAHWVAADVLGHTQPFFAPVAAIVALGLNWGARFSRVVEIVVGVAIGVLVADLLVLQIGSSSWWQLPLIVSLAMGAAVFSGVGALLSTQAGVQAVLVTLLLPDPGAGLTRWLDALIGGGVALVIAALAPVAPVRRPRQLAAQAIEQLRDLLLEGVAAAVSDDTDRAHRALTRSRATQQVMVDQIASAARDARDVVRFSPLLGTQHREQVKLIADLVVPLDYALRNTRVLLRRVVTATRGHTTIPQPSLDALALVADACELIARDLADGGRGDAGLAQLRRAAHAVQDVPVGQSVAADALAEQVRSLIVDLLQVAGVSTEDAVAEVPLLGA